jgi:Ca2+/H+ antiporter
MRAFAVYETEIDELKGISGFVTFWCGVGSMAIGLILGAMFQITGSEPITSGQDAFLKGCALVAIGAYVAALWQFFRRKSIITRIKSSSSNEPQTSSESRQA